MVTYAATVLIVVAWGVKMISEKKVHVARTPLDIPIGLFFISQLIASVFSMDPHVSWFGYYSRFNGGMFSVISYILLYYAFVSNWKELSHLTNLLKITLATAVVVALYGALEHFGFSMSCLLFTGKFDVSCWVQDVQNRVFATLGQPNWLAAYLVALIPVSFALALRKSIKHVEFWVWMIVSVVFFATLLFTKSRSGLIAAAVSDVLFWVVLFLPALLKKKSSELKNRLAPIILLHIAFAAIIFFFGTNVDFLDKYVTLQSIQSRMHAAAKTAKPTAPAVPAVQTDTLLTTGGTESGVIRGYVWEGAVNAWKSSVKTFFVGTGTETFAFAFYKFKPIGHNLTSEWDYLYNKAHNEYLNFLATTGILGLGTYVLFLGVFMVWFLKNQKAKQEPLAIGLFAGWISILITNFFGFSVVITQLFLFLFPAMIFVFVGSDKAFIRSLSFSHTILKIAYSIVILFGIMLLYVLGRLWYADTLYAKGYQFHRFGKDGEANSSLAQAIKENPTEPVYYDEDSVVLAELAMANLDARDATTAAILAKQSLTESDKSLSISPNNVNFWKSRTKIFYAFAAFDPQFVEAAIEALLHAQKLSPVDPKITYNLAILYGKSNDNAKAVKYLRDSITLKPNYRDAYAALVIFYKETKQTDLAKQILQEYLSKVDPNDKDFKDQLKVL